MPKATLDPRLRALYLIAVAIGVFLVHTWWIVGTVAAIQAVLWMAVGLGVPRLLRQLRKLALFLGFILACFALVTNDPATDRWRTLVIPVLHWGIDINLSGALVGLTMVMRVLSVVLASQVIRAGDPKALAAGLGRLGVPRTVSLSIDAVLALLGERGRRGGGGGGGGTGGGGGGGRGRGDGGGDGKAEGGGFWAGLRRLARGDVSLIAASLRRQMARAEEHVVAQGETEGRRARDVAVISGIALTMLGIKALKLLPGLPFAPGHKGVILIPLYIVAGRLTKSRAGATLTGLTMGSCAFLLGDGRYGIFEIFKHVAPGVVVDLGMPIMRGRRAIWAWSLFGLVIALGRFATIACIALAVQAPAVVYAFLLPGLAIHATFGVLSGIVTAPLIRALPQDDEENAATEAE